MSRRVFFWPKVMRFYSEAVLPGTMRSVFDGAITAECADWRDRSDPERNDIAHVVKIRRTASTGPSYSPSVTRVFIRPTLREAKALVQRVMRTALS